MNNNTTTIYSNATTSNITISLQNEGTKQTDEKLATKDKVAEIDGQIASIEKQRDELKKQRDELVKADKDALLIQSEEQQMSNEAETAVKSEQQMNKVSELPIELNKQTSGEQDAKFGKPNSEISENKKDGEVPVKTSQPISLGQWRAEYEAVVGLKHRKPLPPFPCQDAAFATLSPCPIIITADGAGSSETSDIGSQRVVSGVRRLIDTLYNSQFSALDDVTPIKEEEIKRWALILVKHSMGILEDLAQEYRRPAKDFRCTLLTAVVGKYHTFWFKVGDGALVIETVKDNEYTLSCLGKVGKGEYANETTFISESLSIKDVDSGILSSSNVSALFSMSDGAALRLVNNNGDKVAPKLSYFAQKLRAEELNRLELTKFFYSEGFLNGHDGDDCSIALIAR